uniref:Uncharacterized protein n=1 Tax=Heterorhabditis bacteriophora TaxID=37862 RepID=A0A1I7W610_HETBA
MFSVSLYTVLVAINLNKLKYLFQIRITGPNGQIAVFKNLKGKYLKLQDVITKGSLQMDWFFKYSLIRDIVEVCRKMRDYLGIYFLHHSTFGAHGWISSGSCLVDERWQYKYCKEIYVFSYNCQYLKSLCCNIKYSLRICDIIYIK